MLGILLYLHGHTHPDISFSVKQRATCFLDLSTHMKSLEKIIERHLKGIREKIILMTLTEVLQMYCYVDWDFTGLWNYEDSQDPTSVKNRSGLLFTIEGCPISQNLRIQT